MSEPSNTSNRMVDQRAQTAEVARLAAELGRSIDSPATTAPAAGKPARRRAAKRPRSGPIRL